MRGSTSRRPRVSFVVSPDADEQVAELPDDRDDRTTWEGQRWIALQAFARREGVRLPPPSPVVFIATEPLATDAECVLCGRPIDLGARARLDAVLPTTFVHEACRLHEHLAEWSAWQKRNK